MPRPITVPLEFKTRKFGLGQAGPPTKRFIGLHENSLGLIMPYSKYFNQNGLEF